MTRNKLMLNNEWESIFTGLPDEQAGQLIKAAFAVHAGKATRIEDPILSAVFGMMESVIVQNKEAYEAKCVRNSVNGSKGGRPKTEEKRTVLKETEEKRTVTTESERGAKKANRIEKNRIELNNIKEKEEKEREKSGKPDLMPAINEIVSYLNEKASTKYRPYSRATAELIKGRLGERYTVDDFKKVIDNMTAQWKGDPKMEQYLRPETLFARSHFESYLNAKPKPANKFQNFQPRQDQEHKDMVAKIIAMQ